jgi:hypothetical protein
MPLLVLARFLRGRLATKPTELPYRPEDLAATMLRLLAFDPDGEFHTPDGRPHKIVNDGKVIRELRVALV